MKHKFFLIAAILILTFAATPNARTQWVQTSVPTGCPVTCFVNSSSTIFAGTYWGGVSSTTDNGTSWEPVDNGLMALDLEAQALVISGTDIFVGTQSDNSEIGGVFRSTNQGSSWVSMNTGLPGTAIVSLVTIDTNLFVSTSKGVFLSTNKGANWTGVNNRLTNDSTVTSFATIGSTLFAVGGYVFRSTNSGMSWTNESSGLFGATQGLITAIGVSGTNLFVGESGLYGGVFLSADSGANWTPANTGLPTDNDNFYVGAFASVGTNVFVGTDSGVYLTTNNGESWRSVGLENVGNYGWVQPLAVCDSELFAGTMEYSRLFDSGAIWRRPLSQMLNTSAVMPSPTSQTSITAYPNPCSQSSTITFSCAESGTAKVTILNLLGAEVARVYEGELSPGEHSFTWDASRAAPGMYECVVNVNGNVQRTAISLLR